MGLALSSVLEHRKASIDYVRAAALRSVVLARRRRRDGWFRQVAARTDLAASGTLDPRSALCRLVERTNLHQGWEVVGGGAVSLAFALLEIKPPAVGSGRPDHKVRESWAIGTEVLLRTLSSCSSSVRDIVPRLCTAIRTFRAPPQYVACLRRVVREALSLCMENTGLLGDLVGSLKELGVPGARRTLAALIPLIKVPICTKKEIFLLQLQLGTFLKFSISTSVSCFFRSTARYGIPPS